jgi:hypothetical protein
MGLFRTSLLVALSCTLGFRSELISAGEVSLLDRPAISKLKIYADESPTSRVNIIAISGGFGLYDANKNQAYLSRVKNDLTKEAINLYFFPNYDWDEEALPTVRASDERMGRLAKLIEEIKSRNSLPIYVAGFSRGAIETSLAANRFDIEGVIIMSGVYYGKATKREPLKPRFVTQKILKKTDKRLLVVHHVKDQCEQAPFSEAKKFYNKVVASDKTFIRLDGGYTDHGNVCGQLHYHGFDGIEDEATKQIIDWVLKR